jgi:hypothetical protein
MGSDYSSTGDAAPLVKQMTHFSLAFSIAPSYLKKPTTFVPHLVTRALRFCNHPLQFINFPLRATKCPKLWIQAVLVFHSLHKAEVSARVTNPLLCQLSSTLVFAITQEFNYATFVRCETMHEN